MKQFFLNLSLFCSSILLVFVAGEVFVRLFIPLSTTKLQTKHYSQEGIGFIPNSSWTYEEPEFTEKVSINSWGFRDIEIDPSQETVVILGDSQTFGTGVQFGERFSDLLRTKLETVCSTSKFNILNVAMPGASTAEELNMLQGVLQKGLKVKHVMLFVVGNDHYENLQKFKKELSDNSKSIEQKKQGIIAGIKKKITYALKSIRYSSHLIIISMRELTEFDWFRKLYLLFKYNSGLGELLDTEDIYIDGPGIRQKLSSTEFYIDKIRQIADTTVVLIPERYRYDSQLRELVSARLKRLGQAEEKINFEIESLLLSEIASKNNLQFIDPISPFKNYSQPQKLSFPINGHMTPVAHKMLADEVFSQSLLMKKLCN